MALRAIVESPRRRSNGFTLAIALAVAVLVALADRFVDLELSWGLFYLIPVFLVSWFVGAPLAIGFSAISAALALWGDLGGVALHSGPVVLYLNAGVRLGFFLVTVYLVTRLRGTLETQRNLAQIDPLTGIANQRAFLEAAEAESRRTRRYRYSVSLAYIDLDNFKAINDSYGHSVGDKVLKAVAQTLRENIRATDSVGRLGGDEFAVLLPQTNLEGAKVLLEKLRLRLLETAREQNWPVTFSIGSITFSRFVTADEMIRRADSLMYSVKQGSKDAINWDLTGGDQG